MVGAANVVALRWLYYWEAQEPKGIVMISGWWGIKNGWVWVSKIISKGIMQNHSQRRERVAWRSDNLGLGTIWGSWLQGYPGEVQRVEKGTCIMSSNLPRYNSYLNSKLADFSSQICFSTRKQCFPWGGITWTFYSKLGWLWAVNFSRECVSWSLWLENHETNYSIGWEKRNCMILFEYQLIRITA